MFNTFDVYISSSLIIHVLVLMYAVLSEVILACKVRNIMLDICGQ